MLQERLAMGIRMHIWLTALRLDITSVQPNSRKRWFSITAISGSLARTTRQQDQILVAGTKYIMLAIRIRIRVIFMGGGGNINGDARS
jgi:hypothetical protein